MEWVIIIQPMPDGTIHSDHLNLSAGVALGVLRRLVADYEAEGIVEPEPDAEGGIAAADPAG